MSRIANNPVVIPAGVDINLDGSNITVKGSKGQLTQALHKTVSCDVADNLLQVTWDKADKKASAQAGTARANISNMVVGVTVGFEKKLALIGVGYRAQLKGKALNLSLGLSHPVEYSVPEGITIETPSQTEIIVKGSDKQQVGQVSAEIRAYRPPEPYKGKGIRYADEHVVRKEAKKK
ncbi:MAG TPA: 50S ribosomal protein L6 [Methylococcaceae bacterium]|jgi:large subunit ribosomal protein L6|nr:50S ribosomal protein L6 [Methylococcaceae bacterium]HIA44556.1 50S ribosomal protein L6 [Methylococcaceae bacterium]HIB61979.1 50S ribosomal protein L6 [Methylococcaceae bacterium]HIN68365.1 50S ribosomal protein L6 [Methylococcales bacterium]HIO45621.1 50S ribosomal protein L6 [Methylococcales bacterium]